MTLKPLALALALAAALTGPARAVDLPTALKAAVQADPALASALANRDAAIENIAIARARLLPQISAQTTQQMVNQTTTTGGAARHFTGQSNSSAISLRQTVYRLRDFVGLQIGQLQARYGELRLETARSETMARTTLAWVDVLGAKAQRDVYAATVDSVKVSALQEKRRFDAGDSTRDAVAEAEAQLALARAQLVESENDLAAKLRAFNLLTRLAVTDFPGFRLPDGGQWAEPAEGEAAMLERALDTNPELLAGRVTETINERRLVQAGADHHPTLDMVGSMNRAENDTTNTLGYQYHNAQVGLQLVIPIYSGGGINAAQRQAAAALSASVSDREAIEQRIRIQFASEWGSQRGLRERAAASAELVRAVREQRRAYEFGIKAGTRTWADLGATELQLARREAERISINTALYKSEARLLGLLPADDPAWDKWTTSLSSLASR